MFGVDPPMSQLRQAQVTIFKRYQSAAKQWGHIVARFDSTSVDHEHVVQRDRPEDQLAAWLHDFRHRNGDDIDDDLPEKSSHPKWSTNPAELHKCSWCKNPSAVLRKCGGCEQARYGAKRRVGVIGKLIACLGTVMRVAKSLRGPSTRMCARFARLCHRPPER